MTRRTGVVVDCAPAEPRFIMHQASSSYMSPTLECGDLAQVDTSDVRPNEGLFLIRFPEGEPALRRLQPQLNGRIRVSIDVAPHGADEHDPSELAGIIIGRVVKIWNGKTIAGARL